MKPDFSKFDMKDKADKLTMAGVLTEFWNLMPRKKPWVQTTQENNERDLRDVILPFFADYALEDYTPEMIQERYELLETIETLRFGDGSTYAPKSLRHFRYLIQRTYEVASVKNICPNILWGTTFLDQKENNPGKIEAEIRTRLHKSLMPKEEYNLEKEVFCDYMQSGEKQFALMAWALGGRPQEIADLQYEDILPIDVRRGRYVIAIITTIDGDHSKLGGKTKAMFRFVPISRRLYRFLMARKYEIQKWIAENKNGASKDHPDIEKYYICCDGDNYTRRCKIRKAADTCRDILRTIGISETMMRYYDEKSKGNVDVTVWGVEKEVTTYVLRRNFATKLFHLGLDMDEVLYLMGHTMKDCIQKKSDFRNDDKMNIVFDKFEYRAIFNPLPDWEKSAIIIGDKDGSIIAPITPQVCIKLDSSIKAGKIIVTVTTNEANEPINLQGKFTTKDGKSATIYGRYYADKAHGEQRPQVKVLNDYLKMYASEEALRPGRKEKFPFLEDEVMPNISVE